MQIQNIYMTEEEFISMNEKGVFPFMANFVFVQKTAEPVANQEQNEPVEERTDVSSEPVIEEDLEQPEQETTPDEEPTDNKEEELTEESAPVPVQDYIQAGPELKQEGILETIDLVDDECRIMGVKIKLTQSQYAAITFYMAKKSCTVDISEYADYVLGTPLEYDGAESRLKKHLQRFKRALKDFKLTIKRNRNNLCLSWL